MECPHCGEWIQVRPGSCEGCGVRLEGWERVTKRYCGAGCRKRAWRARERRAARSGGREVEKGKEAVAALAKLIPGLKTGAELAKREVVEAEIVPIPGAW